MEKLKWEWPSKTSLWKWLNAIENPQGQQNNKWEDGENKQSKFFYTKIP